MFNLFQQQEDDTDETILEVKRERDMDARQSKLFEGLKFFLGRETNLESLTFVIKACGGMVSHAKLFSLFVKWKWLMGKPAFYLYVLIILEC